MQKRIIDSHTMKVFMTRADLKRNGITALDLLGNHNQIEKFFYKILDQVDTQHLFAVHEPLTFRVIPNKIGLDIIISYHSNSMIIRRSQSRLLSSVNTHSFNHNIIKLNHFEDFIQISHLLKLKQNNSSLYRYRDHYYLELSFNNELTKTEQDTIKDQLAVAYEYGNRTSISLKTLKIHGKVIMKNHALEQCRHYFH